jgi:hypothetical protein
MTTAGRKGLARAVNYWVQTVAIIVAGIWAAYTFIYLEFRKPAAAPTNLSTQITLQELGARQMSAPDGAVLVAVEIEITANNPSSRTVYILPNYWRAMGYRVGQRPPALAWLDAANAGIRDRARAGAGEHYAFASGALVASGSVVPDMELRPGESLSRSYVFYVPQGAYDLIDVETVVPSTSRPNGIDLNWRVQADGMVNLEIYRVGEGERHALSPSEQGHFLAEDLDLQSAESQRQLSLWRRGTTN